MFSRISTVSFQGVEAAHVDVQVQISSGSVLFTLVGLPDKAIAESKERVRAALNASGLALPAKRIIVNLAPADLPKEGSHYDLPIALGLMVAMGALPADAVEGFLVLGELSLDGGITHVNGTLPAAISAVAAEKGLICPESCGSEAAWADENLKIIAPSSLVQLYRYFRGELMLSDPKPRSSPQNYSSLDLADIRGQESAKRALEIAAAGSHNLLMIGPPGSGKTLLASRLPTLLPPLSPRELLEVSMVASISGELEDGALSDQRPFRAPHHSASMASLVGGGMKAKPGEVSLAHNGVLFLDELPEFEGSVLDSLRQPIENGVATIVRANYRVSYPSVVQVVAAMNPCRCGYAGEPGHTCRRGDRCASTYQSRISGPFLDRMDLQLHVPAVSAKDLIGPSASEGSAEVAQRVMKARMVQQERFRSLGLQITVNAHASARVIEQIVELDQGSKELIERAAIQFGLSARGYHRVLKLSRTIADMDGSECVQRIHLAEALNFKRSSTYLAAA
ncbi:YifB family Mg chelatase-like AAA ATPase [Pseudovibrio sp. Tun.PSC04-5.I4]|uniref:YifB family Mg chelatase-like AAA ATPase n=1 Tax=Pseudovibrio sp. Tun.PSC04-5.I4 TaxID=1798213 RepID=UPI000887EA3E|nr:YifB family Mg chelatase-like AAA ATPase [Pseudovibrio sp. Tun.PSC04-5.I4]SDR25875.1 magnesium chelatase family protein [Pseudovibrio sp. Tun.PSC04-5.I4]